MPHRLSLLTCSAGSLPNPEHPGMGMVANHLSPTPLHAQPIPMEPEKAIQAVYNRWITAIGSAHGDPQRITALYAPNALLVPTLSPHIVGHEDAGLHSYFRQLTSKQDLQCIPEESIFHIISRTVVLHAGFYRFAFTDHNGPQELSARFSFLYEYLHGEWLIIHHHSSALPS